MAKITVHLKSPDNPHKSMCGLNFPYSSYCFTTDPKKVNCKTCKKALRAWEK